MGTVMDPGPPDPSVHRILFLLEWMGEVSQSRHLHQELRRVGDSVPRLQCGAIRVYRMHWRIAYDARPRDAIRIDPHDHQYGGRDSFGENQGCAFARGFREP